MHDSAALIPDVNDATSAHTRDVALEFLLRRMRHRTDFPALSESVTRILRTADSEDESLADLTRLILEDVALTQKLLRLVNSVQFAHLGRGSISTVSRAVSLVGFNTVRNLALSLVLLDHMPDKAHAQQMKQEFVRALMAGAVAGEIAPASRDSEGAFLGALFQNLGRMLVTFYFQEESDEIRRLLAEPDFKGDEESAAQQVLGLGLEDLAVGVAKSWGLPDNLQRAMRKPTGPPPTKAPEDPVERMRWVGAAANDVAIAAMYAEPAALPQHMRTLSRRYASVVAGDADALAEFALRARRKLVQLTDAMRLDVVAGSPAARLLEPDREPELKAAPVPAGKAEPEVLQTVEEVRKSYAKARAARLQGAEEPPISELPVLSSSEILSAGVQDIVNAMASGSVRIDDVLRMVLETMFRALGFRQVLFCLRDARSDEMRGRFGLGEGSERAVKLLKVPLGTQGDLFAALCRKGSDLLFADTTEPRAVQRLPEWYRNGFPDAGAFVVLPLMVKEKPLGLIYADSAQPGGITLDEKGFALLRTLRNQAVMAFRQG
ncbi:MAG: HDOD domain-containing protein [Pseudomonadota bacterium]